MNRRKAVIKFRLGSKTVSAAICVFPPGTYMIDLHERAYAKNADDHAFLYTPEPIWWREPSDGPVESGFKIKSTTRSSIGTEVPVFSRELWTIKHASLFDCVELVGIQLKAPRLFSHPEHDAAPPCSFDVIAKFLREIDAESSLRLFAVHVSYLQFNSRKPTPISNSVIDAFMEFNKREFGSYPTKRLQKRHRADYNELGIVDLGYVGREETA